MDFSYFNVGDEVHNEITGTYTHRIIKIFPNWSGYAAIGEHIETGELAMIVHNSSHMCNDIYQLSDVGLGFVE